MTHEDFPVKVRYLLDGQSLHDIVCVLGWYLPGVQEVHPLASLLVWCLPAGQLAAWLHEGLPFEAWYFPLGQVEQNVFCVLSWNFPAGHLNTSATPVLHVLNSPAAASQVGQAASAAHTQHNASMSSRSANTPHAPEDPDEAALIVVGKPAARVTAVGPAPKQIDTHDGRACWAGHFLACFRKTRKK